jgi:hypothetical protein
LSGLWRLPDSPDELKHAQLSMQFALNEPNKTWHKLSQPLLQEILHSDGILLQIMCLSPEYRDDGFLILGKMTHKELIS